MKLKIITYGSNKAKVKNLNVEGLNSVEIMGNYVLQRLALKETYKITITKK